jgi:hypothetical protein
MKRSIEDKIRKLLAVKKPEPTALYEPAPMENESAVESITPKGGGGRGTEGCDYSSGAGDSYFYGGRDPNNAATTFFTPYDFPPYADCAVCNGGAPPAFCACIAAYRNPCYNWHWSTGDPPGVDHPDSTWEPPAYPSYPPGCPSREELTAPGYTVEEWVGNPETLSGQRYIWGNWNWISRVQRPDGSFDFPNHVDGALEFVFNCGPEPVRHPDYDPLDPDSVCGYAADGQRIYMRDAYAFWFAANPSYVGRIPSLLQRRMMEMGCYGVPFVRSTGSCCTFSEFGTASCTTTTSSSCKGVFTPGGNCNGQNPCGGGAPNPLQQNDQGKKQKEAMDMVMSLLKRK